MSDWLPFLSGFLGALVGAGASLAGIFLTTRAQRRIQRDERDATQAMTRRQEAVVASASAGGVLYQLKACIATREQHRLLDIYDGWETAKRSVMAFRVTEAHPDLAMLAARLVDDLDNAVIVVEQWLSAIPYQEEGAEDEFFDEDDAWTHWFKAQASVDALVERVRSAHGFDGHAIPAATRPEPKRKK